MRHLRLWGREKRSTQCNLVLGSIPRGPAVECRLENGDRHGQAAQRVARGEDAERDDAEEEGPNGHAKAENGKRTCDWGDEKTSRRGKKGAECS